MNFVVGSSGLNYRNRDLFRDSDTVTVGEISDKKEFLLI